MAEHYGTAIIPARSLSPKDKPNAEGTVYVNHIISLIKFLLKSVVLKRVIEMVLNRESEKKNRIKEHFLHLREKKILIYGSGIIAKRTISALEDFDIVGVLDRYQIEGELSGIPILTWEDLNIQDADCIIIASLEKNYKAVYNRIIYKCIAYEISIYGADGTKFGEDYLLNCCTTTLEAAMYFSNNKEELKGIIEQYEAISFDLFDTLIMRKTLEPLDVFDIVEERLIEKGIVIPHLKKKRRSAELASGGKDIYHIYEILSDMLKLDKHTCETIMQEEIACEKACIVPRKIMVEMLNYAVSLGKKVCIVSDMYLTTEILGDILSDIGIHGYDKIYVSCEYGKGKGNGIFEYYLDDIKCSTYLHIGDNYDVDIVAPKKYGIDTYEIWGAFDMLKHSNFCRCLRYEKGKYDRLLIGMLIAELFNDPFALHMSSGVVRIKSAALAGKVFAGAVVLLYMQELQKALTEKNYKGILFGARDGYLLKKLYDSGILGCRDNDIESKYFLTSRLLSVKASIFTEEDIVGMMNGWGSECSNDALSNIFHIEKVKCGTEEEIKLQYDSMLRQAAQSRKNYITYMKQEGIDLNDSYLFCDWFSRGNIHKKLNGLFHGKLDGYYYCRGYDEAIKTVDVKSPYGAEDVKIDQKSVEFLEKIVTSPDPSVYDIDNNGEPIFSEDNRTTVDLAVLHDIQDEIVQFIKQYAEFYKKHIKLNKELAVFMVSLNGDVIYEEEAKFFNRVQIEDDVTGKIVE